MNPLLAINLGLAPVLPRPDIPDGIVRRFICPERTQRKMPAAFYDKEVRRQAMVDFIRVNQPVSGIEVSEWAGCDVNTSRIDLQVLSRRGMVVHVGWCGKRGRLKLWSTPDAPTC